MDLFFGKIFISYIRLKKYRIFPINFVALKWRYSLCLRNEQFKGLNNFLKEKTNRNFLLRSSNFLQHGDTLDIMHNNFQENCLKSSAGNYFVGADHPL